MPATPRVAFALVLAACGTTAPGVPTLAPREDLREAIAEMRNLPTKLEGAEAEQRGPRIQKAWTTLIAAKDAGVDALLAEARQLDCTGERDDRFRLGAGTVVWQIGGLARVDDILTLWSDADFAVKYSYAFSVAGQAASSKDPRALPLMAALLRDQGGEVQLSQHAMTVGWPGTHMLLWAPLGHEAGPALAKLLTTQGDPTTAASCAVLLAGLWHVEALPQLRTLAREGVGAARTAAVQAVGRFGHPDDFEWLVAGIAADDVELAVAHIAAVAAFGDLQVVPHLLAKLEHPDERLRTAAIRALAVLPELAGIDAVMAWLATVDDRGASEEVEIRLCLLFADEIDMDIDSYGRMSADERQRRIARARSKPTEEMRTREGDRQLSRAELHELCAAATADGRIPSRFEWAEARHLLAAATAEDLPALLDARGGLYQRFSDEQIESIGRLDQVLRWLARSQYRSDPGVCEQVQRAPDRRATR